VPEHDRDALKTAGAQEIFGPGTNIQAAAQRVLMLIAARRLHHAAE